MSVCSRDVEIEGLFKSFAVMFSPLDSSNAPVLSIPCIARFNPRTRLNTRGMSIAQRIHWL